MTSNTPMNDANLGPSSSAPKTPSDNITTPHLEGSYQNKEDFEYQALITPLIEGQIAFIQQWLSSPERQQQLGLSFWHWLGQQPLNRYIAASDITRLINEGILAHTMTDTVRGDIRSVLHTIVFHPINDTVSFSELVEDAQISALAQYIASHESQRNALIHALIGNEAFTDMLTQTLYHAINDFMQTSLEKAGGMGKLMKFGRSSFEKATNNNLDDKLQAYLRRNIKDLAQTLETNAKSQLSNEEVAGLIEKGWSQIKLAPISSVQQYLTEPDNALTMKDPIFMSDKTNPTLNQLEAGFHHSYNRFRASPISHTLVSASIQTWFDRHLDDTLATVAKNLNISDSSVLAMMPTLAPLIADLIDSPWLAQAIKQMLTAFYHQPSIRSHLTGPCL